MSGIRETREGSWFRVNRKISLIGESASLERCMRDGGSSSGAWFIGVWFALTALQIPRFYFDAYSSNKFVFLGDLVVPKLFFLIISAALVKGESSPAIRHVLFLLSVLIALTLPQLWAPSWFAIGIFVIAFLLAGIAFFMEATFARRS